MGTILIQTTTQDWECSSIVKYLLTIHKVQHPIPNITYLHTHVFCRIELHSQWHASFSKAAPPTAAPPRKQIFKHMHLWATFLMQTKPPATIVPFYYLCQSNLLRPSVPVEWMMHDENQTQNSNFLNLDNLNIIRPIFSKAKPNCSTKK